ncbi:unnamed protein product [Pelagomonas calceolata]|uniref:Uncharacterized protein n=1 Tax=Pelagomonas calceolata TaxID=35677 RepID=A0A7S3ZYH7_9STRA|nr:unnamed protein product [Pelagomonas calceolata]
MAQCVVCSEDIDLAAAKSFPCCDALYCDACHEETAEGGTCGECFADLTAAAAPPPPPADSTPQLAPAMRPVTPTVFAVAPKPTLVALGTPSDCGTPNPRVSGTPAHERLAGDLRRVVLRKVDGNSPRSSPPPVPSPKIVTALQSGALRPTGSDATPRTATVKRFNDAEKALQRARETAAAAQAVQEAAVKETAARRQAAERAAAARSRNEARMPPRRSTSPRARAPSAKSPRRRSKSPRRSSVDLEAGPTVVKLKTAVAELSEANRKRTTGPRPRRSLSRRLAVLLAGLLFFGAASFYTAASVLEAPSNRSAVPPPRKRTSRRYLGTNSSKKKRLRGAA